MAPEPSNGPVAGHSNPRGPPGKSLRRRFLASAFLPAHQKRGRGPKQGVPGQHRNRWRPALAMLYCGPLNLPWPKLPIGGVYLYVHLYPVPDGVDFRPTALPSRPATSTTTVPPETPNKRTPPPRGLVLVGIGALVRVSWPRSRPTTACLFDGC